MILRYGLQVIYQRITGSDGKTGRLYIKAGPVLFYDIAFRKKIYHSVEELQADANQWLKKYNGCRPHSGARCFGKTPMQTFTEGKQIASEKQLESHYEIREDQAQLANVDDASHDAASHLASTNEAEAILASNVLDVNYYCRFASISVAGFDA